jgi:hypothetical protein
MHRSFVRIAAACAAGWSALIAAVPALAAGPVLQAGRDDVIEPVVWTLVAVAIIAVVGGVLYLLKRQLGGFPERPGWVAPIEPIYSRDLPTDDAMPHEPAEVRAHDERH